MKATAAGLRLRGAVTDLARLDALLAAHPGLDSGPWWTHDGFDDGSYLIVSAELFRTQAEGLEPLAFDGEVGVSVATGAPLPPATRRSAHLLEALRPIASPHDEVPDEACFVVPAGDPAATRTVERLLRLGRGDAQISQWDAPEGVMLALRVPKPPLYLLLRARDGEEPVAAYARHRATNLWVAWSCQHPLADLAAARLAGAGQGALVDADGRWTTVPAAWEQRSLLALTDALLPAPEATLTASAAEPVRFRVTLRLELDRPRAPTLWVLTPAQLTALLPLVEATPLEGLGAVTLARMAGDAGVRYVVRLRAGAEDDGIADRLAGLLQATGYVRVPGAERIFVPAGMRLMPPMRVEALRAVLLPPEGGVVVVEDTRDGPSVLRIGPAPEAPLRDLVDYLALDHRPTLEALLESAVFALPGFQLDRTLSPVQRAKRPPPPPRQPRPARPRVAVPAPVAAPEVVTEADQIRAWRQEAEPLQALVAAGGVTDAGVWLHLGTLLDHLGDADDAGLCLEAAAFHAEDAGSEQAAIAALTTTRMAQIGVGAGQVAEAMLAAATQDRPAAAAVALLGAAAVRDLAAGGLMDGLGPLLIQAFAQRQGQSSRRLAWLVLRALHGATSDLLGLTRAKEVLLGGLNSDGLREAFDTPRFVRLGLALGGEDAAVGAGAATDLQRAALSAAWSLVEGDLDDLDLQATLYRAIFAVGFGQTGDLARARSLAHDVEELRPLFDPPGRALLRLYLARLECLGVEDAGPIWRRAVAEATQGLGSREQSAVDFARRRSLWLAEGATPPRTLDSGVAARLADLAEEAEAIPAALRSPGFSFDYLVADLVEGALALADATGRDALMAESRDAALVALEHLDIPGHRATVIGAALRTSALLEDEASVHGLIELFVRQIPEMESVAEILRAVDPAMAALRRIGLGGEAERFLLSLRDVARRGHREAVKVAVFVADGFRLLGDVPAAERTLGEIEQAIYSASLDPIARFEGASALFATLRSWSVSARELAGSKALESLDLFRDNFTTQRYFRLHRFLLVERVVDALSDTRAHGGGRLRQWLEAEEQAVRRRIVADWRSAR